MSFISISATHLWVESWEKLSLFSMFLIKDFCREETPSKQALLSHVAFACPSCSHKLWLPCLEEQ
eukprot:c31016_g1_i1 orf=88-282(-)